MKLSIIVCFCVKNELNRINTSNNPHMPNLKIFELPGDFIPHISANMGVISMKMRERVLLITRYLCA